MIKGLKGGILFSLPFLFSPVVVSALKVPELPNHDYKIPFEDTASGRMYVAMDSGIISHEDSLASRLQKFLANRKLDMWGDKFTEVALFSDPPHAKPRESIKKGEKKAWADLALVRAELTQDAG